MTLCTPFTELLSLRHPIALVSMGGSADGALAVAVFNGNGLGNHCGPVGDVFHNRASLFECVELIVEP